MKILRTVFIVALILNLFFTSLVRYVIITVFGNELLIYAVNAVMLVLTAKKFLGSLKVIRPAYIILYACIFFLIVLGLFTQNLPQTLFAVYILIPAFFSIAFHKDIATFIQANSRWFIFIYIALLGGVIYDYYFDFVWKTALFTVGNVEKEIAKNWTAAGVERVAGFCRSSFSAALALIIMMMILFYNLKSFTWKTLVFISTIIGIYITTTKGCLISVFVIYAAYLSEFLPGNIKKPTLSFTAILFATILILLPIYLFKVEVPYLSNDSLLDRINTTWPLAFTLFKEPWHLIFGTGIGSLGAPQLLFGNPNLYNPGDNLFIYVFANYGLLGLFLILFLLGKFVEFGNQNRIATYFTMLIFTYGITTNLIESPECQILFGYLIAFYGSRSSLSNSLSYSGYIKTPALSFFR